MFRETSVYTVYETKAEIDLVIDRGKGVSQIAKGAEYRQNGPFAWHDGKVYHPIGHIIKDGKIIQQSQAATKWGAFIVPKQGGRPYIGYINLETANIANIKLAFQSTPIILPAILTAKEGTPNDVVRSVIRSAIGVKPDGTVVLVTTKTPHTLPQLADLMKSLGCIEALNLDGGGSVTYSYKGQPVRSYERPVSSAIVVKGGNSSVEKPVVTIDAGHGGKDPGASGNGIIEKDMTLAISLYQYERFKQLGIPVALTRNADVAIESGARAALVKQIDAPYCISNHINSAQNQNAKGSQFIHSIYATDKMAKTLAKHLEAAGQPTHSIYTRKGSDGRDYYYMHRETGRVETTIIEYGFLTNPEDAKNLKDNWQKYAEAIVKGMCEFLGKPYTPPVVEQPKPKHWAQADHDELRAAGILLNDHPDLDAPATKGFVLSLINRIRKEGK